ncbi:MAG: transporter related protein [Pseudomonadota bacterium]|jgi:ABC-type lipoprotein export system ATPase subunit
MNEPLLRVDAVERHYDDGAVRALDGVDFDARVGETIALTGPSGCGKSTLLSLIGLLDQPTRGRILVAGQDLGRIRRPADFRARTLGFVFQFHHMVPTMTLCENVMAPMLALGVPRVERRERAMAMLARMDLSARADFLPARVSGGERQRAAVARALVNRPQVVLADEPTGNLDSRNGQRVIGLLLEQSRAHGALVIVATHNPEVADACDRRIELRDGRLTERADAGHGADAIALADRPRSVCLDDREAA